MFPLNSGPRVGQRSEHFKVVAGSHGCVVTQSSRKRKISILINLSLTGRLRQPPISKIYVEVQISYFFLTGE